MYQSVQLRVQLSAEFRWNTSILGFAGLEVSDSTSFVSDASKDKYYKHPLSI